MFIRSDKKSDGGFTLIELLITIAIIGVLAGIAIPMYITQQNQAYKAAAIADGHAWAMNTASILNPYSSYGTAPGGKTTAITLSGTTLTVQMSSPIPSTPTSVTAQVGVSSGSSITESGISGTSWCFKVTNTNQVAVYTQAGYQSTATTCSAAGVAS